MTKTQAVRGCIGAFLGLAVCLLAGCSRNMLESYPVQMHTTREALQQGRWQAADKQVVAQKPSGKPGVLYQAELARVQQISGQYQRSIETYAHAIQQVEHTSMAAKVQVSRVLANAASLLTNDDAIPFIMPGYGKVFLYAYQALNYFSLHQPIDGMVNIRSVINQQRFIQQQHDKELAAAEKAAHGKGFKYQQKDYQQYFAKTSAAAGKIKSAFENGFAYYLSSIAFQAGGHDNDAFVAAKDALGVMPGNPFIQQQLLNVLMQRGDDPSAVAHYQRQFGLHHAPVYPKDSAKLVVIYAQGLVPPPASLSIPVPLPIDGNLQIQMVSIPIYQTIKHKPPVLQLSSAGRTWCHTAVAVNVEQLAAKSLLENYPLIIKRAALRLIAKAALVQASEKQAGDVGGLVAQLFTLLTAKADLRAWLTLPSTIQIWQRELPSGVDTARLSAGAVQQSIQVHLRAHHTTVLWVMQPGNQMRVETLNLF